MPCGLCGGRMGCDGSGRGPPGGMFGRIGGYDGRCGAGRVETPPGPPPGPPGLARFPVAGGSGAVGRGGTVLSDGRSRDAAGRVGIAGTAEVPGALGSSILNLMLGGTMRPGAGVGRDGAAGAAAAGRAAAGRRRDRRLDRGRRSRRLFNNSAASGWSVVAAAAAEMGASTAGAGSSSGSSTGAGGASLPRAALRRPSRPAQPASPFSRAAAARASARRALPAPASWRWAPASWRRASTTGPSANMSPPGSVMLRSRARRSTNCRATTSSIVLDALFSSMPCARFSSASTSWLLVLRSSATL